MKMAWFLLIVSASIDFGITFATSLGTVMVASGETAMPSQAAILLTVLGASVSGLRTIQQALKASTQSADALRGTGNGGKLPDEGNGKP